MTHDRTQPLRQPLMLGLGATAVSAVRSRCSPQLFGTADTAVAPQFLAWTRH